MTTSPSNGQAQAVPLPAARLIWPLARPAAKIVRLLRRVAGVRHILTTESRLPVPQCFTADQTCAGRPAVAPNLETRSARRTAGHHTNTPSKAQVLSRESDAVIGPRHA